MCSASSAQKNIAELLGYPAESKLLIMHADDLGVGHAVNQASFEAFEKGGISSSSIMVPCPWFSEVAEYASKNPQFCWGLHLTLTSEWKYYKWDGAAPSSSISSLLNEDGYMYDNVPEFVEMALVDEVETELRAQVDKALAAGINVSHLDSHMGALFANLDLFKIYVKVGNDYDLPVMIPGAMAPPSWNIEELMGPVQYPLDNLMMLDKFSPDWDQAYDDLVDRVKPGLNEIIVHLGYSNNEMESIMMDHPAFGSAWRQKDLDYVLSDRFSEKLVDNNIILVSYKSIREALMKQGN